MKTEILMTAIFLTASAIAFVKRTARHLTLLRSQMSDKNWPSLAVKKFIFPLLFVGYAFGSSALAQSQQPNIVIILADDMGYGDVSYNGCPDYQTPNIDAFASNGILCTNGYVSHPFCSPSRLPSPLVYQKPVSSLDIVPTAAAAAVSESTIAPNGIHAPKSARVEFSATSQSVAGHEIDGFSVRQAGTAREENLIPPAGLKPVEQEAWLAMARRQEASGDMELVSFYPKRYGDPFVVEGEGVRVAVRPVSGTDTAVQIDDDQVIYRNAYPETDSMHFVSAGRSEEFLFLQDDCAPREFEYELSELSAGARVELVKGEVHFSNKAGQGVKIEAPWLIEATGEQRAGAVRWELEESKSGAPYRLRLVVTKGLSYPVLIDPSWVPTGNLVTARTRHTATLLPNGKVLVAGGNNGPALSSAELYDPASGTWTATGSLGTARERPTATLLPNGKVLVAGRAADDTNDFKSAELYDPATGTWTATGSMATGRAYHTATLLANGKVLVAGGSNN